MGPILPAAHGGGTDTGTWSSYRAAFGGNYRRWWAQKGWTFEEMGRVCYAWQDECNTPDDRIPRPELRLTPEMVAQYRLERKGTPPAPRHIHEPTRPTLTAYAVLSF